MSRRVAVVGAGLAGLAAARELQAGGADVEVFDKGRRPGGRANTRVHGERRYDHGAQYFTVRDPAVRPWLQAWRRMGLVAEWRGRIVHVDDGAVTPAHAAARFVAVPGMVNLALHLAHDLQVRAGVRIETIHRSDGLWTLTDARGETLGPYRQVVVAVPAPQAVSLLEAAPTLQGKASEATMEPCWTAMISFDRPLDLAFDGAFLRGGAFSWMARNSSKPGRPEEEAWVIHATPHWTREHWDEDEETVCALVLDTLRRDFGLASIPSPVYARAHRWGYALASEPADDILYEPELGLGACGDWRVGGRVEGALLSGLEIARRLTLDRRP